MKQVFWLPSAQKDLRSLWEYYAPRAGQKTTAKMLQDITRSASYLIEHPSIGVVSDEPDILEWHVTKYPYTLMYRVQDNDIEILRVWHQSQNKPSHWERL